MKYSVIIPIYNAEATLGRCLDSLLEQPHGDAEILLINDGSTDNSAELCRQYAREHDCVRYFEKENGGVSSARNLGLEAAAGEYILFVDSDDCVTPDYFAVIDQTMERRDPDMLLFGLQCFGGRNDDWKMGAFCDDRQLEVAKFVRKMANAYLYSGLMTKSFRREIIRRYDLRFDEALQIGEDQAFIFAYTMHIKRMASIENVLYRYGVEREESLSRKKRPYLTGQLLRANMLMHDALDRSGYSGRVRRIYRKTVAWTHYRSAYSSCKELLKFDLTDRERRIRIRQICESYRSAGIAPSGLHTWLIALPVLGKMSRLLDLMACCREHQRNKIH